MSSKIHQTTFRPGKPLLVWDADCGFCHYWVIRWEKMTGNRVEYRPHSDVLDTIQDIPEPVFKQAAQLIEPDGKIHSGAAAAYKTLSLAGRWKILYRLYRNSKFFRVLSDQGYRFVANHRQGMYKVTVAMFGRNPARMSHRWLIYLLVLVLAVAILVYIS